MSKKIFIFLSVFIILVGLTVYFGVWNSLKSQKVFLYYYNSENDKDEEGNIMCSRKGLRR